MITTHIYLLWPAARAPSLVYYAHAPCLRIIYRVVIAMTPRPHVCVCVCVCGVCVCLATGVQPLHATEPLYVQHDTNNRSLNSQDVLPLMQALDSNQLLCLHHSTLVPKINTGNTHNKHGSPRGSVTRVARRIFRGLKREHGIAGVRTGSGDRGRCALLRTYTARRGVRESASGL